MTSKNLFFKLVKQDMKKRIWCPIIIGIAYFLMLEVMQIMRIQYILDRGRNARYTINEYMTDYFFAPNDIGYIVMACIVAFVTAISGFIYLNSKKQLDTYHSMPVSRLKLFASKYVSGILQFFIPFVVNVIISLIIGAWFGGFSLEVLVNCLVYIGLTLLFFLLTYSASIMAVCLTGNTIISVIAVGVIFVYSIAVNLVTEAIFSRFLHTFILADYPSIYDGFIPAFSPLDIICRFFMISDGAEHVTSNQVHYIGMVIIAILAYALLAYIFYKIRGTEAATKAIAFNWTKPVLKTFITIPLALCSALMFDAMGNSNHISWFVFGAIFGYIIASVVMEIIFDLDIRSGLKHKKQFLFNGACLALIIIVIKNDVLGYNTYVPNESQIESCAVYIEGLNNNSDWTWIEGVGTNYISPDDYVMQNMMLVDNPSVMRLARKLANEGIEYEDIVYYDGIEDTPEYKQHIEKEDGYRRIIFGYRLSNHKAVYRQYIVDIDDEESLQLLADIYNDENYKLGSLPVLSDGWQTEWSSILCKNRLGEDTTVDVTPELQTRLKQALYNDYMNQTLDDVMREAPIGSIRCNERFDVEGEYTMTRESDDYLIYEYFTETLALMKEYGIDYSELPQVDNISIVRVGFEVSSVEDMEIIDEKIAETGYAYNEYTDKEQIKSILKGLVSSDYRQYSYWVDNELYDYDVQDLYIVDKNGNHLGCMFIKNQIPQFVLDDIENYGK